MFIFLSSSFLLLPIFSSVSNTAAGHDLLSQVRSGKVRSDQVLSCPVLSCPVMSCHVMSSQVKSV